MSRLRTAVPELVPSRSPVERALALLRADLRYLSLPTPTLTLTELSLEIGAPPPTTLVRAPVDHVLSARVQTPDMPVDVYFPISGDAVLPVEIVGRLELPSPASALLTRRGWTPHPHQDEDEVAAAFLAAMEEESELGQDLSWSLPLRDGSLDLDWTIQLVADAADSCQLVVRTAPLGEAMDRAGIEAFLDTLPVLRSLMRRWPHAFALPLGVARDCLALQALPDGERFEVDWPTEPAKVYVPDELDEGDLDEPTEIERPPQLLNLALPDALPNGLVLYEDPLAEEITVIDELTVDRGALPAGAEGGEAEVGEAGAPSADEAADELSAFEVLVGGDEDDEEGEYHAVLVPAAGEEVAYEAVVIDDESFEDIVEEDIVEEDIVEEIIGEAVVAEEEGDEEEADEASAESASAEDSAVEDAAEAPAAEAPAAEAPTAIDTPAAPRPGPAPALAAASSLLLPGLGQVLCGQRRKGYLVMAFAVVTLGLGGILNIVMAVDAWTQAKALREGRA